MPDGRRSGTARAAAGARILLLVPEFPPRSSGGGGLVYLRLAEEYARAGAKVRVVALDVTRAGWLARPLREARDGYDVVYLPVAARAVARGTSFTGALPPSLPGLRFLAHEVRSGAWDAMHLHGVPMLIEDLGAGLARLRGRRYLLTVHGLVQAPERFGGLLALVYRSWLAWERWIYRNARAITAVSRATLEECESLGLKGRAMAVVGVTPHPRPPAVPEGDEQGWLARNGLAKGSYVACVGNFVPRKGQDLLIEALGTLRSTPGPAGAVVAAFAGSEFGTGFRGELEHRAKDLGIADRVRFLGRISDTEKMTLYRYCRAAIVPTRYEASPMVAFEALELGLPLVASDIACLRELLRDGETALLFRSGDPRALAEALRRICEDPGLAASLGSAARQRAALFPTWSEIAHEYLDLLLGGETSSVASGSVQRAE